jgi:hypothetical protein
MEHLPAYLYGPGKAFEHVNLHLVGGWRPPETLEPPMRADGRRDFRRLAGLLEVPLALLGDRAPDLPVWRVPVWAAPEDPILGDGAWMAIAAELMHRTGLSEHGHEYEGVPWVAVHHGDNHIHIVAILARLDCRRARLHFDYYRIGEAMAGLNGSTACAGSSGPTGPAKASASAISPPCCPRSSVRGSLSETPLVLLL